MISPGTLILITCALTFPGINVHVSELKLTTGKVRGQTEHFIVERIPFTDSDGQPFWINPRVASPFADLVEAANKEGYFVSINSAHRTPQEQRKLWLAMPDIAGHPDHGSERSHQTGYAIDIAGTSKPFSHFYVREWQQKHNRKMHLAHCDKRSWGYKCPTVFYWWLKRNAHRFGFYENVKSERWHWTYLGK